MTRRDQASIDADHRLHDQLLIVRAVADDLHPTEVPAARELVARCAECAAIADDLRAIAFATASLPAPRRTRDFRLTGEQASALRGSPWQRLLRRLAAPRMAVLQPLASAAIAIGLVLVVVGNGFPGQTSVPATEEPGGSVMTPTDASAPAAPSEPPLPASTAAATLETTLTGPGAPAEAPYPPTAGAEATNGAEVAPPRAAETPAPTESRFSRTDGQPGASPQDEPAATTPASGESDPNTASVQSPGPTDPSESLVIPDDAEPLGADAQPLRPSGTGQAIMFLGAALAVVGVLVFGLRLLARREAAGRPDR